MRTWTKVFVTALTVAALVSAGQLGVAYALGILRWNQAFTGPTEHLWAAHLTWASYIAVVSVTAGALGGRRAIRRHGLRDGFGAWTAVAVAALIGAAVTVPLVALPAEDSRVPVPLDPVLNAGLAASLGGAVGFFAALALLAARPVAGGMIATAVWVWLLALASAGAWLGETSTPDGQRLGVLDLPVLADRLEQDLVLPVMVGVAVLTGAVIAVYARWLDEHPIAAAASGLAGPALVGSAYLIAGPAGPALDRREPWFAALVAVGAGFAASLLVTVLWRRRTDADTAVPATATTVRSWPEAGGDPGISAGPRAARAGDAAASARPAAASATRVSGPDDDYVTWVAGLGTTSRRELPRQRGR
jgi:hypothetical protein